VPTQVRFCETPADDSQFLRVEGSFAAGATLRLVAQFRSDADDVDFYAGPLDAQQQVTPSVECTALADEDCSGILRDASPIYIEMVDKGGATAESLVLTFLVQ
jgi:hypothetical protein